MVSNTQNLATMIKSCFSQQLYALASFSVSHVCGFYIPSSVQEMYYVAEIGSFDTNWYCFVKPEMSYAIPNSTNVWWSLNPDSRISLVVSDQSDAFT
jgi:hypothetical protein